MDGTDAARHRRRAATSGSQVRALTALRLPIPLFLCLPFLSTQATSGPRSWISRYSAKPSGSPVPIRCVEIEWRARVDTAGVPEHQQERKKGTIGEDMAARHPIVGRMRLPSDPTRTLGGDILWLDMLADADVSGT